MSPTTPCLPLAGPTEPVRYVVIDDEPIYRRHALPPSAAHETLLVGDYGTVEAFLAVHREPCHVIILDLCLNRLTGDAAVLHGVTAVRQLADGGGHRVLVHTADGRPEPVARCVAAGALGYISKFAPDELAQAVTEIGRQGRVASPTLDDALRRIARSSPDIRLSEPLEQTLVLLGRGLSDADIAQLRCLSPRTIEDHKRKILQLFGDHMEAQQIGFAGLTQQLGVGPRRHRQRPSDRPPRARPHPPRNALEAAIVTINPNGTQTGPDQDPGKVALHEVRRADSSSRIRRPEESFIPRCPSSPFPVPASQPQPLTSVTE